MGEFWEDIFTEPETVDPDTFPIWVPCDRSPASGKRAQVAMASGKATANATLEYAFRTESYRNAVTLHPDGRWSYEQETLLIIRGRDEPFLHKDRNTLSMLAEPLPNPLMRIG